MQDDEIWTAFREAMRHDSTGRLTISTQDFVTQLQQRNAPHTLRAANYWIEMHISVFSDISTEPGECRLFQVPERRD